MKQILLIIAPPIDAIPRLGMVGGVKAMIVVLVVAVMGREDSLRQ